MTREEATELLNQYNLYSPTKQIEEAIDMAIEALQWQDRILTQIEDIVLKEHGERREDGEE